MKIFPFFFLLFASISASSQTTFQKISFDEALSQSQKTGKLILVQLESLDCERCNYVVAKAFKDPTLSKRISEEFIALKIDSKHSDRNLINGLYDLDNTSFGTFFIDNNKNLVHRINRTTDYPQAYVDEFETARFKHSEVIKLNVFSEVYEKYKSNDHLERWIWARNGLNLSNDS